MMLGKRPVPGRPANMDYSKYSTTRVFALAIGSGVVVWTFFLSAIISLLSLSFWETTRYRLKYYLKRSFNPNNQPTNIECRGAY